MEPNAPNGQDIQARRHHYIFAHKVLPKMFFDDPEKFLDIVAHYGNHFLKWLWADVGERIKGGNGIPIEGLNHRIIKRENGLMVVVIVLPMPVVTPEAYFVAAAYRSASASHPEPMVRFITLERSRLPEEGREDTFLCEWTRDEAHLNYGKGCKPDIESFVVAILALLEQRNRTRTSWIKRIFRKR